MLRYELRFLFCFQLRSRLISVLSSQGGAFLVKITNARVGAVNEAEHII